MDPIISPEAILKNPGLINIGENVEIMEFSIIGQANFYPEIFKNNEERRVEIGSGTKIYPWVLIYEGAILGEKILMEERTTVGSLTKIGNNTRILYQAQVNDNITIGENCIIGGFIADNSRIGSGCSIFGSLIHRYKDGRPESWDEIDEPGPEIGNDVVIGWGAVIIGEVKIGSGTFISPNSVVKQDVPENYKYYENRKKSQ